MTRWAKSSVRFIAMLVLGLALIPAAAWADPVCSSGSLSSMLGTTCDIGTLQFSFTGFGSNNGQWSASDFTLTPVAGTSTGFTLAFDGGPQSLSTSGGAFLEDVFLDYSVTDLGGVINGQNATGGALTVTGTGANGQAYYYGSTYQVIGGAANTSNRVGGGVEQLDFGGNFLTVTGEHNTGVPFVSGVGQAYPFVLYTDGAGSLSRASWDGTPTTFTFNDPPVAPTPEPSSLLLMLAGTGLLGIMWFGRGRQASTKA